jgi:hypothetical protein
MKTMKTTGGLIHGRGVSEGVLTRLTMGMTPLQRICEEMEERYRLYNFRTACGYEKLKNVQGQ